MCFSVFKIYYFREQACEGGGADGEGEANSQADSALGIEPDVGLEPTAPKNMT